MLPSRSRILAETISNSGPVMLKISTCHDKNLDLSWLKSRPITMKISTSHDKNLDLS